MERKIGLDVCDAEEEIMWDTTDKDTVREGEKVKNPDLRLIDGRHEGVQRDDNKQV